MDEKRSFSDPEVESEIVAISDRLEERMRACRAEYRRMLWSMVACASVAFLIWKFVPLDAKRSELLEGILTLSLPLVFIQMLAIRVIGGKWIRRSFYRKEGVHCMCCDRLPTDSRTNKLATWVAGRRCPYCGGALDLYAGWRKDV